MIHTTMMIRSQQVENNGGINMKMLNADEVKDILRISKPKAYVIIKQLNKELNEKGYLTIAGKIMEDYLYERLGGKCN